MSFVDDLNRRPSKEELLHEENRCIERYTRSIIDAIKCSCTKNKTKHTLSGYYGRNDYEEYDEIVPMDKNSKRFSSIVVLDTEKKYLDINKFDRYLHKEISRLGFTDYEVKIIPRMHYKTGKKIPTGKSFFGKIIYEDELKPSYYQVWVKLNW